MADHRNEERERIVRAYRALQSRQIIAITAALFLVALLAVVHRRPDLFGAYAKSSLFAGQAIIICAFLGFTAVNWRCPSCRAFLSSDMFRRRCKRCGAELQ